MFRAEDVRLRRPVAVKQVQLLPEGPDDSVGTRHRAMREAHAAARLSDPHVVTVYDVLEERNSIWLVMELVDAPSLSQLVADEGPLDPARAARIGLDVLGALTSAHGVGVVHRDVKPANVMVLPGDRAKLTDFGVAKMRDDTQVTATGLVIGSPSYMAPEQARGERAGPAADLWALGSTLYFAVEGVPPFSGNNAIAVATAVVYGLPRPPERAGPLTPLLRSLLAKEPADRPGPEAVRRALHDASRVLAPSSRSGFPKAPRRRRRRPSPTDESGNTAVFPSPSAPPAGEAAAAAPAAPPSPGIAPSPSGPARGGVPDSGSGMAEWLAAANAGVAADEVAPPTPPTRADVVPSEAPSAPASALDAASPGREQVAGDAEDPVAPPDDEAVAAGAADGASGPAGPIAAGEGATSPTEALHEPTTPQRELAGEAEDAASSNGLAGKGRGGVTDVPDEASSPSGEAPD